MHLQIRVLKVAVLYANYIRSSFHIRAHLQNHMIKHHGQAFKSVVMQK